MKCTECNGVGKWDYGTGLHEVETCKFCNGTGFSVRREVKWFAERMEETLKRNDHKGGWDECDPFWLLSRMEQEIKELRTAMLKDWTNVVSEATDVANFAMMIADIYRFKPIIPDESQAYGNDCPVGKCES